MRNIHRIETGWRQQNPSYLGARSLVDLAGSQEVEVREKASQRWIQVSRPRDVPQARLAFECRHKPAVSLEADPLNERDPAEVGQVALRHVPLDRDQRSFEPKVPPGRCTGERCTERG
eukprot:764231-Hanusia_phi.AAC.1